ncbi:hypothetical protein L593_10265 [Salinarchaeum sp. Harcht-Bsk1]|uniref:hypothetical protein n=1 Tax=Salinarchaeum sp. Harcht-Bsk1 TaxID=1333523 RepID=UPI0003424910|nr:hypothetical protein [Salinarchaeum sp. Harcht-Bsk1]AGN01998.1 hypothetical protein L593_10265 [Salinarchaeum sp. Harcht-Bsk1]
MPHLDRLRQPEYTGENRCMACTYVNVLLTVCFTALLVAVAAQLLGPTPALGVGAVFAVLAAGSIWLRGYLVPKTPTLTKQYLPKSVLEKFGKAPDVGVAPAGAHDDQTAERDAAEEGVEAFDHEQLLLDAGAVEPCEDVDDLCLTDAFDRDWSAHLEALPDELDPETAAAEIGIDLGREHVHVQRYEKGTVVTEHDRPIVEWPSEAAMRLDAAGARTLADHSAQWDAFDFRQRAALVAGLRVFVEECPDGQPAELSEEQVESCCTSHTVVTLECADSGARLFEWQVD